MPEFEPDACRFVTFMTVYHQKTWSECPKIFWKCSLVWILVEHGKKYNLTFGSNLQPVTSETFV